MRLYAPTISYDYVFHVCAYWETSSKKMNISAYNKIFFGIAMR